MSAETSSNDVNARVISACWTRLNDLHTLGKLTKDQKGILSDQIEVNDGEVIRHLMMEPSDKIVKLAGDLMYEINLTKNIDGERWDAQHIYVIWKLVHVVV